MCKESKSSVYCAKLLSCKSLKNLDDGHLGDLEVYDADFIICLRDCCASSSTPLFTYPCQVSTVLIKAQICLLKKKSKSAMNIDGSLNLKSVNF